MTPTYTITRVNDAVLRLDRATSPYRAIAFALLNCDRRGAPVGWRLKPLTTVRGSKNQLWPTSLLLIKRTVTNMSPHCKPFVKTMSNCHSS